MGQLFGAFGIEGKLLIAQILNFAIVCGVLWYFLFRPLSKMLQKRKEMIAKSVDQACQVEEKLAGADAVAAEKVGTAEVEAEKIVSSAREAATDERVRIVKEAEARATAVAQDAEARAKETAAKILLESEKEIARLAILAAGKVMQEK